MIPLLAGVLTTLASNGLGMLANAIQAKGKEVIEEKLGVKIPDDPAKLTPELLQQLQIKQMEHEEFLVTSNLEEQKLAAGDTKSARDMNTAISTSADASWLSKNIVPILALIVIVGGMAVLTFHHETEVRITVGNLMMLVLGFYFGTSLGSVKASQLLRDQVKK